MGYKYCEARRKGILSGADQAARVKFARAALKSYGEAFWMNDICFYLDGVSFWYKRNPANDAKSPSGKIWRRRNEGLNPNCTAKNSTSCQLCNISKEGHSVSIHFETDSSKLL